MIDLRSDTVTRPTAAMREAMVTAPLGDDVLGDDPTVLRLEQTVADLLGKQAALFVTSGTLSNQLAVRLHCQPGDELICESQCHIYHYEQASYAQLSGVAIQPLVTPGGLPMPEQLVAAIKPDDYHFPRSRLLCLENTHNRWGGRTLDFEATEALCDEAARLGLACHLDGARLWNAAVADPAPWREAIRRWAGLFDTVSVCFSKGLGAPVGSALVGSAEAITQARRARKAFGGGWRQAGLLAAGVLHALEHHVDRLADDHRHAQRLVEVIRATNGLTLVDDRCDTNLVFFDIDPALGTAPEAAGRLADRGIELLALGPQRLRAVTHLDVSREQIEQAAETLAMLPTIHEAPSKIGLAY